MQMRRINKCVIHLPDIFLLKCRIFAKEPNYKTFYMKRNLTLLALVFAVSSAFENHRDRFLIPSLASYGRCPYRFSLAFVVV